jgi:hypothetical protein
MYEVVSIKSEFKPDFNDPFKRFKVPRGPLTKTPNTSALLVFRTLSLPAATRRPSAEGKKSAYNGDAYGGDADIAPADCQSA